MQMCRMDETAAVANVQGGGGGSDGEGGALVT